jgi:hypothetical protein
MNSNWCDSIIYSFVDTHSVFKLSGWSDPTCAVALSTVADAIVRPFELDPHCVLQTTQC